MRAHRRSPRWSRRSHAAPATSPGHGRDRRARRRGLRSCPSHLGGTGRGPGPVGRCLVPPGALAGSDGSVRPEFVWAALDCAGGIGALGDATGGPPYVLGRLSARQIGPVRAGEPHIVAGWRLAEDGRKMTAGSALFTATGQAVGVARATWIRLGHRRYHAPGLPAPAAMPVQPGRTHLAANTKHEHRRQHHGDRHGQAVRVPRPVRPDAWLVPLPSKVTREAATDRW